MIDVRTIESDLSLLGRDRTEEWLDAALRGQQSKSVLVDITGIQGIELLAKAWPKLSPEKKSLIDHASASVLESQNWRLNSGMAERQVGAVVFFANLISKINPVQAVGPLVLVFKEIYLGNMTNPSLDIDSLAESLSLLYQKLDATVAFDFTHHELTTLIDLSQIFNDIVVRLYHQRSAESKGNFLNGFKRIHELHGLMFAIQSLLQYRNVIAESLPNDWAVQWKEVLFEGFDVSSDTGSRLPEYEFEGATGTYNLRGYLNFIDSKYPQFDCEDITSNETQEDNLANTEMAGDWEYLNALLSIKLPHQAVSNLSTPVVA